MEFARRHFMAHAARLAGLGALALAFPGQALSRTAWYPFRLGVASGSPRPNGMVLWTRLSAEPLNPAPFAQLAATVRWELAEDDSFRRIVAKGSATALPELGHSVHVDVAGLASDRWYWYRFMLGDAVSPTGRTRTAPAPGATPDNLRFAVASCQHWEFGHYAAHRHIAAANPDLILFLGDYIYEWGPYDASHPQAARSRDIECFTLDDYRRRYAQYKADADLQAAHQAAPWMVTWDDHEVANDYANDRDERLDPGFLQRRASAYQAFYEHMPLRMPSLPDSADRFAFMRIYERYDWGRLARFNMLDLRQYRDHQACNKPGRGGSTTIGAACSERNLSGRSLLGQTQEDWLAKGLADSPAQWNLIGQQTLMAHSGQAPSDAGGERRVWNDAWDGYPAARQRLFADLARHRPANPLVLGGDVHTFYATELRSDFERPVSAANPVLASEFCGTSITSSSRLQSRTDLVVADNPHIKFGRSDRRGFMLMNLSRKAADMQFIALDNVRLSDSGIFKLAGFTVEDGRPGPQQTE